MINTSTKSQLFHTFIALFFYLSSVFSCYDNFFDFQDLISIIHIKLDI